MRRTILTAAFLMSIPAAAFAQATAPNPKVQPAMVPAEAMLSYNVIGLKLQNANNENVGEIKDIVVDNGKLSGYIVSVGGFLGMGERYVIVSPASVKVTYSEADKKWTATMAATKDELKTAPEFKYEGRWAK